MAPIYILTGRACPHLAILTVVRVRSRRSDFGPLSALHDCGWRFIGLARVISIPTSALHTMASVKKLLVYEIVKVQSGYFCENAEICKMSKPVIIHRFPDAYYI